MSEPSDATPQFLVHEDGDHVAVTVVDIAPGAARGAVLASDRDVTVDVSEHVPLGHKFALTDIPEGGDVIEYGVRVGIASAGIARGSYVHTHNLRSARWQTSIAS